MRWEAPWASRYSRIPIMTRNYSTIASVFRSDSLTLPRYPSLVVCPNLVVRPLSHDQRRNLLVKMYAGNSGRCYTFRNFWINYEIFTSQKPELNIKNHKIAAYITGGDVLWRCRLVKVVGYLLQDIALGKLGTFRMSSCTFKHEHDTIDRLPLVPLRQGTQQIWSRKN